MTDISVIIVNYNVKELLEQCILSIFSASKNLNVEIIVVDNNSFDESVDYLKSKFGSNPSVKIIASPFNLGFAKANNFGAKQAKGEYLLILNPDTILQEDTLDKTLDFYKKTEHIGALTCKLILPSGKLDLACRRSFPTPSVAVYRIMGLSRLFPKSKIFGKYNLTYLDENMTYEVDAIVGAFMLIKKDLFDRVNGFDEEYFMYGEDIDLCYRIKKNGHKIFYYPETSIIHYKGESTKKSSLSYVSNFYGAMQIFVKKNLNDSFVLMNVLVKISIFYRSLVSYVKRFLSSYFPVILDIVLIVIAMFIAIYQRFEFFPIKAYSLVIFIYTAIWLITLSLNGSYNQQNKFSLIRPLNGILIGFFVNSSFTYFFNEYAFSRVVVLRTAFNAYLLLALWRIIAKIVIHSKSRSLFFNSKTLIVGRNGETERFVSKIKTRIDSQYEILGYISTDGNASHGFVGNLNNLKDIIAAYKITNVIFAKNELTNQAILDLMWSLKNYNVNFKILSGDSDILLGKSAIDKIDDIYLMKIEYNINKKINIFAKRLFDLLFGIICLFTLYPVGLLLSVFFRSSDHVTKFMNKIKMIPSVITGKLSFVGRATWDTTTHSQHLGKNGLTGLVQINYYKNLSLEEVEYFNYYYAKNQTLTLDMEIILKTVSLFLFRKNLPQL